MTGKPNDRYSELKQDSPSARLAARMRRKMFAEFMRAAAPAPDDLALDVGATSDRSFADSNYFEQYYPYKERLIAVGYDDAGFLTGQYPGLQFVRADGCCLPFPAACFDIVHSGAVIEHVGDRARQMAFLGEMIRVSRRAVFLTTPNRWFPIELHTQIPLLHWLPAARYRRMLRRIGKDFYADERNLNLLDQRVLEAMLRQFPGIEYRFVKMRLLGWCSNLLVVIRKK